MRTLLIVVALLFAAVGAYAYEADDLQGKWLIVSMESSGTVIEGDGTDFWEFTGSDYTVYSSGIKLSTTEFSVKGDAIIIKARAGDHSIPIVSLDGDELKVTESGFTFTLIRQ